MSYPAVFNVVEFGADNTGVVDSTAAIQAAVNAALNVAQMAANFTNAASVHLPAGTYLINSTNTFTIPNVLSGQPGTYSAAIGIRGNPDNIGAINISIYGDGPLATTLLWGYPYAGGVFQTNPVGSLFAAIGENISFREFSVQTRLPGLINGTNPTLAGTVGGAVWTNVASKYSIATGALPNSTSINQSVGSAFYFADYPATTGSATGYKGGNYYLDDLSIFGVYIAINFDNCVTTGSNTNLITAGQFWITNCDISNSFLYGILVNKFAGNGYIDNCQISASATVVTSGSTQYQPWFNSVGLRINTGDGYQISNCIITIQGYAGLVILPIQYFDLTAIGEGYTSVVNLFFSQVQFDKIQNPMGSAALLDASFVSTTSNQSIANIYFTGCAFTAAASYGLYLRFCHHVIVNNCNVTSNQYHGIFVANMVSHFHVVGGQFYQNSAFSTRTYDGIYLFAGTSDFSIVNAICSATGTFPSGVQSGANNQRFGITVAATGSDSSGSGPSDRYIISGCDVSGYSALPNPSGGTSFVGYGINDRGNGKNKKVSGNIGYNPLGNPLTTFYINENQSPPYTQFTFPITPVVPASGTAYENPFGIDATVVLSGGTVTGITVQGPVGSPVALPPSSPMIRFPASSTITLTYSVAPTMGWILE